MDVVPEVFKAEGVFASLARFVGGADALRNLNVLIPRASVARDFLPKALQEAGARVDIVPAYRTSLPTDLDRGRVAAMLSGDADCIAFTSASTVKNLAQLFDTHDLSEPLAGVAVACIGDVTAATAVEFGLDVEIQPAESTTPALARAIADYFAYLTFANPNHKAPGIRSITRLRITKHLKLYYSCVTLVAFRGWHLFQSAHQSLPSYFVLNCSTMSSSSRRILVVDSDADSGEALKQQIAPWGYEVILELNSSPSIDSILKNDPAVIIDSSTLISGDGLDVLRHVKTYQTGIPVILLAERGSIELAVQAIQDEGAYHYFEKPVDANKLRVVLDRAVELTEAKRENERLRRQLQERGAFGELIGNSAPMREIYSLIEQVAPSSASVLITGESGTGKELVARTIHQLSPRRDKPFVGINCSAIPESLMESELFGHEKGAFTGAASRRQGCFELADGGTLLLDEIAEMPEMLQAKLLRVIEERSVAAPR